MAMSHENCTHPRTPAGRAACRKAGGPGQVSTPTQTAPKATTAPVVSRPTREPRTSLSGVLRDLPGTFHTTVDWARDNGCAVTTTSPRAQRCVHLANPRGTLTLTWDPATPSGVHAVSWRPVGTSVTSRLMTVNEGLTKLKGE